MRRDAKRVFLTGASSGIGAALAHYYLERGATVGLVARRGEALRAIAAPYPADRVASFAIDVADADAMHQAGEAFLARAGTPDVVIANAGISHGTLTEIREDAATFRDVMATNVLGMVHTFAPFVAPMRAAGAGALVGIASVAGFRGLPGASAYSASKAAAITYLESLRVELVGSGVRVVTVCPGYVATPMTARNPYRMPFLMTPERAALRIARAIAAGRRWYVVPWPMAVVGAVLRAMPRPIYDAAFARAPRKPRRTI